MKIDVATVRRLLRECDFKSLFREQLGWDNYAAKLEVPLDGTTYSLAAVAEKRGFQVFCCGTIPDRATRMKLDRQVTKSAHEHLIIYVAPDRTQQLWEWVRREQGKPAASRDYRYYCNATGEALIQKLEQLAISLEEEEKLTLPDVGKKVKSALDVDKITKRFYDRFKAEHAIFMKFIKGIKNDPDLQWYTSLMLNRLMFVYFIQKKGFLDGDPDYLRNRLALMGKLHGKDKFYSFYRYFLLKLFHDGLGKPQSERDRQLHELLGNVPFLDGGFFEVHKLEDPSGPYPSIEIPDAAFLKLFEFFDAYRWHLDERPLRADNEINPDVVGYIFEKYINQKQMGAYYTKEDITEYIAKNTIIPFLFDAAEKKCAIAFKPDAALWRLLRDDPDRYIYPAVGHGVSCTYDRVTHRDHKPLAKPLPLPKEIEAGIADVSKRGGWNKPAAEGYGLPTETWREVVARRQRCEEIRQKLRRGEVHQINDLITLNLDIWQFARDVIVNAEGPELLRAFYRVLAGYIPRQSNEKYERGMSILDPTCGSGAFLFAALRILETLYSDCLERMRRFVQEAEAAEQTDQSPKRERGVERAAGSRKYPDFRDTLAEITKHANERYFVLKSIIINNLFGVDIMEEAVEICKLRLFLKLVAQVERADQIEPLPDIDFNIRPGNTLVGYVSLDEVRRSQAGTFGFGEGELKRIEDDALCADGAYKRFRQTQVRHGSYVSSEDKAELRRRLDTLDDQLDHYLAGEYGVKTDKPKEYDTWRVGHQPLHWLVEFFGIMRDGGFDVIIGNPPYVSARKARPYSIRSLASAVCPDIYAWCLERVTSLGQPLVRSGMIVPLSLTFSSDFGVIRRALLQTYSLNWFSSFGRIPSALFSFDVRVRNTIHLGARHETQSHTFSTRLHRWFDVERPTLFQRVQYAEVRPSLWGSRVPKLGGDILVRAFERLLSLPNARVERNLLERRTAHKLYFKKTAYNWLNFCRVLPPCFDECDRPIEHTKFGELHFETAEQAALHALLLNGKIQFAFWLAIGDDFDVTRWMFAELPVDTGLLPAQVRHSLTSRLSPALDEAMAAATSFKLNAGKRVGNYNLARCRHVTDEADRLILEALDLAPAWDALELIYVQCVRTDFDDDGHEEE